MKKKIILGITMGHGDSSAAIISGDTVVAAAEEERFTRLKHDASFPTNAVKYCIDKAGIHPNEIGLVVVPSKPIRSLVPRLALFMKSPQSIQLWKNRLSKQGNFRLSYFLKRLGIRRAGIRRVEHHRAHLMSVRMQIEAENVALMSFDGLGDFVSTTLATSKKHQVQIQNRIYFPNSLGFFYTAITQYLGFNHFGDEFKVMGLSAFGRPRFLNVMKQIVKPVGKFAFELNPQVFPLLKIPSGLSIENNQPKIPPLYHRNMLTQLLGFAPRRNEETIDQKHCDLAASLQVHFEDLSNRLLNYLHETSGQSTLGLAGGCAHNSVWVGKIRENTPFKNIYVAPACHDAGLAMGAAAAYADQKLKPESGHWALMGPDSSFFPADSVGEIESSQRVQFKNEQDLIHWIVNQLCNGKIVGLYRGRLEFGPRALGSRSLLADPRNPEMKDLINAKVKHRESFRPFAASVLYDHQEDWFESSFFSPNMEAVFKVKNAKKIPAVTHVDGTCRVQSVVKASQPFYFALIEAFRKKTSIPMLLNTSFNDQTPIVCSPKDAIRCFRESDVDALVIDDIAYLKEAESAKKVA